MIPASQQLPISAFLLIQNMHTPEESIGKHRGEFSAVTTIGLDSASDVGNQTRRRYHGVNPGVDKRIVQPEASRTRFIHCVHLTGLKPSHQGNEASHIRWKNRLIDLFSLAENAC